MWFAKKQENVPVIFAQNSNFLHTNLFGLTEGSTESVNFHVSLESNMCFSTANIWIRAEPLRKHMVAINKYIDTTLVNSRH